MGTEFARVLLCKLTIIPNKAKNNLRCLDHDSHRSRTLLLPYLGFMLSSGRTDAHTHTSTGF